MINLNDDIILANNMRKRAYTKYSGYNVGAVLKTKNGKKYTGCNNKEKFFNNKCIDIYYYYLYRNQFV